MGQSSTSCCSVMSRPRASHLVDVDASHPSTVDLCADCARSLAQLVVGVVQKGQCGEPCAKLETMMAKMMTKMNGFFNAAIADVRTAVDTGVQGEETTIQSLFNISTLPAIYIYQYGVKEPKKVPSERSLKCVKICDRVVDVLVRYGVGDDDPPRSHRADHRGV